MRRRLKNVYRKARLPLEWFAIGIGKAVLPRLSLPVILRLADTLADVGWRFDRRGTQIAKANLQVMFGARMTAHRERAIIRRCYRNMARVLANIFWLSRDTQARLDQTVSFAPGLFETVQKNLPAILVSAHIGNWEILSQACVARGVPVLSVAKEIGTSGMTKSLIGARAAIGQEIVLADGAIRPMFRAIKDGKCIGLLVDQHTDPWMGGAWVDLCGTPVCMSMAPASLSRKCSVPIILAWSRPFRNGHYRIEPELFLAPAPAADDASRTQQIAAAFERVIRRHPSLWCLNYRRWRYIRLGDDPSKYPPYATVLRPPTAT